MKELIAYYLPTALVAAATIAGIVNWKQLEKASKWYCISIAIALPVNLAAMLAPRNTANFVFQMACCLACYLISCLFVHLVAPALRQLHITKIFALGGTVWWVACMVVAHTSKNAGQSGFLSFQAITDILLPLMAGFIVVRDHEWTWLKRWPPFWLLCIGFVSSSFASLFHISFEILRRDQQAYQALMLFSMLILNASYIAYCIVFLMYRRKNVAIG